MLAGIADLFLVHDRAIHVRCDDSVTRVVGGVELPLRRSRGYAPRPIGLPIPCGVPILAVGGQLKATFALGRGRQAFVSHHMGDLDHYDAYRAFEADVTLYQRLFAVTPASRRARPPPRLRHDPLRPSARRPKASNSSRSSTIMLIWQAAWPNTGWTRPSSG